MTSASVLPSLWKAMSFSIDHDGGANTRIEAFKELVAGHVDARQWMQQGIRHAAAVVSVEEAKETFPYAVLRPDSPQLPLTQSVGVKNAVTVDGKLSADQFTFTFWDQFNKDGEWAVVSQSLDQAATDFMNGRLNGHTSTYADGYKEVRLDDDTIGFIAPRSHKEWLLNVSVWNVQRKEMVRLQVSGNVPEDMILQIAKSYIPAK